MPAILIKILTMFLGSVVAKVLLGAGLAVISYTFVNDLVAQAQSQMMNLYGGLPSDILGVLGILKIPQALSVIMSAIGTASFIKTAKIAIGIKS
mgnify:CR=1 FL=1